MDILLKAIRQQIPVFCLLHKDFLIVQLQSEVVKSTSEIKLQRILEFKSEY